MSASPDRAREEARDILADGRFHETELPRPLERPLEWLGDRLEPIGEAIASIVPGGDSVGFPILAAFVLVAALALATRLVRRRAPSAMRRAGRPDAAERVSPEELERRADEAERAGELERALRLRFRAGILRLAERDVVERPGSVTSGELVRRVRSEPFARAARAFDEVVYGRRPATEDDVRLARDGWSAALAGVRA